MEPLTSSNTIKTATMAVKTATMVIGLPASGKSYFINNIKGEAKVYDDEYCDIENEIADHIILTNPEFCIEKVRDSVFKRLEVAGYSVALIFYENNPGQCIKNAKKRPNKKVNGYIHYLSQLYNPPEDCVKQVWCE